MSQPCRHESPIWAWRSLGALLVVLAVSGCTEQTPTVPAISPEPDKAVPTIRYLGYARPFVPSLQVVAMAALPDRLVATTLGDPAKLVEIDADGEVQPLPVQPDVPADAACQITLSPGLHPGFAQGEILVSAGNAIMRVHLDPPGLETLASLPPEDGDVAGLCFDTVGDFGYALLVLAEMGGVYRQDPNGYLHQLGDVGPGGSGPSVASSFFGSHAGHLIVAFPGSGDVLALSPTGDISRITGWSGATGAFAIPDTPRRFDETQASLFVALRLGESGRIVQYSFDQVARHSGSVVLTSLYASGSGLLTHDNGHFRLHTWGRFLGAEVAATFVQRVAVTTVEVDVLPGGGNTIIWGSTDPIPVGLLSSNQITASIIDPNSVRLTGAAPVPSGKGPLGQLVDLDADGTVDLLLSFRPADMQISPGPVTLVLDGVTYDGDSLRGTTSVIVSAP